MILNKTHQFSDTSTLAAMELWINGVTCFECLFSYYLYVLLLLFFICDIHKKNLHSFHSYCYVKDPRYITYRTMTHWSKWLEILFTIILLSHRNNNLRLSLLSQGKPRFILCPCYSLFAHKVPWQRIQWAASSTVPLRGSGRMSPHPKHSIDIPLVLSKRDFMFFKI